MEEIEKKICGNCVSYDMWCGICLNPKSKLWEMEADEIYDYPSCELFEPEEFYNKKYEK